MQEEKQIPSQEGGKISFASAEKSMELDKRGFDGRGTRAGGVTPLTSREKAPRWGKYRLWTPDSLSRDENLNPQDSRPPLF